MQRVYVVEEGTPKGDAELFDRLDEHLAIRFRRVWPIDVCDAYARGVYEGRAAWTPNFGGIQFTLGRAWYTHLEEDRADEYFAHAAESDATVERYVPRLQSNMRNVLQRILGAPVHPRSAWCGPGVHIFPAGEWVARNGGEVHFDNEGLQTEQLASRCPAFTMVLMLQPPEAGGGLRVWDRMFDGDLYPTPTPDLMTDCAPYDAGDLVMISSYRMHQIEPFGGTRDRISITTHVVWEGDHWDSWF